MVYTKVSIIIPAFNEESTIEAVIERVLAVEIPLQKEIIIVNDGSEDKTEQNAMRTIERHKNKPDVTFIYRRKSNGGKGSAMKTGYSIATGDILICQDADLELFPEDYPTLLKPFFENIEQKVVYGSRILGGNKMGESAFYFGGRFVSLITSLLFGTKLTDQPTGYKIFHKDLIPILIGAQHNGFEWEAEITAKILKKKYTIKKVPIRYQPRKTGKKLQWTDGIKIVWTLFKYKIKA